MIPAGIRPGDVEFFLLDGKLFAMVSGNVTDFNHLPNNVYAVIDNTIDERAHIALNKLGIRDQMKRREHFVRCNCGSYDFTPDVSEGSMTLKREYVACDKRQGLCDVEGELCSAIFIDEKKLTMGQLRVISAIRKGLSDKEICSELDIAVDTLRTHKKNIQVVLGAQGKVEISLMAIKHGIS